MKLHRYPQTVTHNKHIFRCTKFLIVRLIFTKYENSENS